jgi:hypothetical protein
LIERVNWRAIIQGILVGVVSPTVGMAAPSAPGIAINELVASNGSTLVDEDGDTPDWFELHNPGSAAVDLRGWGLSDDRDEPFRWVVEAFVLEPNAFRTVFASGKDRQPAEATAVNPALLPGLRLWLRADQVNPDDPAQVRRQGGNTFVRRWNNRIAGGVPATASGPSAEPLWMASGPGGLPTLRFDGANDRLLLPRILATNDFCLVAVFRTSQSHEIDPEGTAGVGGTGGQHYLFGAQHGGDANGGSGLSVGSNGVSVYEHGSGYMPALAVGHLAPGTTPAVVAVNYRNRRPTLFLQGVRVSEGLTSPRSQVTAPVEIGAGAYGAFAGDLAEVLLFDRSLEETELGGLQKHLADRHRLVLAQPLHTNFRLDADGERLILTRPDGTTADEVRFEAQIRDVSYGRQPDATGGFFFFAEPTPGLPNTTPASVEALAAPWLSHPAGFHSTDFSLTITSFDPAAVIRYTLDGSEPNENSPRYTSPLAITDRAGTPNGISMIPTVPGGARPVGEVFKGWLVRARVFKDGSLPSPTVTRSFFVHGEGRGRYSLPVVSLATSPANFFDPNIGIYVPGNAPNGNYSQRGTDWERPVHVELFETDGTLAFAQDGDVKIHGNTSQGFPIKGLDLDGTGAKGRRPFEYRLFPDRDRTVFEHFMLRPTGHDQMYAFMRDEMMQSLAAETGAETQAARACVVFVNGEYWGLHYLKEKEDAEFVSHYGDHPEDDIDYLEGYAAPKAGDTAHYDAMLSWLARTDLTGAENFAHLETLMEVSNYIDYKVCEVFFHRWDIGNHRLWRPRTPEGRWRWLQFDNDVGWGGFWAEQPAWEFNMLSAVLTPDGGLHGHANEATTFLLRRLTTSPEFRERFVNRFCDLLNSTFLPSHTKARIDQWHDILAPEMAEHIRRWRSPGSLAEWESNVQYLHDYADRRPEHVRKHLANRFDLGATAVLSLHVDDPEGGFIRVNTLPVAAPPGTPWTGLYFRQHPIQLTAEPASGYRFAGWEGLPGLADHSIRLALQDDTTIGARFVPNQETPLRLEASQPGPTGTLRFTISGAPGIACDIEISTDLRNWVKQVSILLDAEGHGTFSWSGTAATRAGFVRLRIP